MLLSHPKQSKNVQNTPKFFVWVCCIDIMSVGPLPWDNNIFIKVLMSTVQRSPKSVQLKGPLGWIAKLRRMRPWCIWIFDCDKLVQSPTCLLCCSSQKPPALTPEKTCYLNRGLCGLQFKTRLHLSICIVWFPLHVQNKWDSVKNSALFKCLNDS